MTLLARKVRRRVRVGACRRRIRTGSQDQPRAFEVAVLGGGVKRRIAGTLGCVRIGAMLEKETDDLRVAAGDRAVERSDAEVVLADDVDQSAALQKGRDRRRPSEERGQVERREAVRR